MQRYSVKYKAGLRLLNGHFLCAMWKFTFSWLKQHLIDVSSLYSSAWGKRFECKADQKFLFLQHPQKRAFFAVGHRGCWRVTKRGENFSHCVTNTLEMVKDDRINHHPPWTPETCSKKLLSFYIDLRAVSLNQPIFLSPQEGL